MTPSLVQRNDDPPDEPEQPCDVCCMEAGSCICLICPSCNETGNLACYTAGEGFALKLTRAQALGRIRARSRAYAEAATREAQYADWLETTEGEIPPHIEDYPTTI